MENQAAENDKKIKTIALVGNIFLWVLLLPSMFFAFGSIFAADAGFTTKIHRITLSAAIAIAFHSPIIVLAGAIASLIARIKGKYKLSLVFVIVSLSLIALSIFLFSLSGYIR